MRGIATPRWNQGWKTIDSPITNVYRSEPRDLFHKAQGLCKNSSTLDSNARSKIKYPRQNCQKLKFEIIQSDKGVRWGCCVWWPLRHEHPKLFVAVNITWDCMKGRFLPMFHTVHSMVQWASKTLLKRSDEHPKLFPSPSIWLTDSRSDEHPKLFLIMTLGQALNRATHSNDQTCRLL